MEISYFVEADIVERRVGNRIERSDATDQSEDSEEEHMLSAPRMSQLLAIAQRQASLARSDSSQSSLVRIESSKDTIIETRTPTVTRTHLQEEKNAHTPEGCRTSHGLDACVFVSNEATLAEHNNTEAFIESHDRRPEDDSGCTPTATARSEPHQQNDHGMPNAARSEVETEEEAKPEKLQKRETLVPANISAIFLSRVPNDQPNKGEDSMADDAQSATLTDEVSENFPARRRHRSICSGGDVSQHAQACTTNMLRRAQTISSTQIRCVYMHVHDSFFVSRSDTTEVPISWVDMTRQLAASYPLVCCLLHSVYETWLIHASGHAYNCMNGQVENFLDVTACTRMMVSALGTTDVKHMHEAAAYV